MALSVAQQALQQTAAYSWFNVVPSLLGVLVGALLTHWSQRRRDAWHEAQRKALQRRNEASAARQAQHALINQRSSLRDMILDLKLPDFAAGRIGWTDVKTMLTFGSAPSLDVASLSFLSERDPNLLYELHINEDKFHTALGALSYRNRLHLELQAAVAAELKLGRAATYEEALALVGPPLVPYVQSLTDALVDAVKRAMFTNRDAFGKLLVRLREEFQPEGCKWLGFDESADKDIEAFLRGGGVNGGPERTGGPNAA